MLSNAGMTHQTLTEKPIEIDEHENVSAQSLREAKKALDDKTKNDQNFIRFYINTTDDDVKIGVTKLREFLYAH